MIVVGVLIMMMTIRRKRGELIGETKEVTTIVNSKHATVRARTFMYEGGGVLIAD